MGAEEEAGTSSTAEASIPDTSKEASEAALAGVVPQTLGGFVHSRAI